MPDNVLPSKQVSDDYLCEQRRSPQEPLLEEAVRFIEMMCQEQPQELLVHDRLAAIRMEVQQTGTYWQTPQEVTYGARVAWRNSTRCIGRLPWNVLYVRDMRHLTTAEDIFQAIVEHLRFTTRAGKIQSTITVFAPQVPHREGIRIWNTQSIRYAGYKQPDGSVLGDPQQAEFTNVLRHLGWKGGAGSPFDVLPLVIQMPGEQPQLFDMPSDVLLEVPLCHPNLPWFTDLGLKWHAVPMISNMRLEIGGISYPAAPFNGWYMGTEIGRNLADEDRYNVLPVIGRRMGLDISKERSLWRDQALVELNKAILYSYSKQDVTIVDHHTASRQFLRHQERERHVGRETHGDWGWLVPPLSGSLSPLFHRSFQDTSLNPNFWYQDSPWSNNGCAYGNDGHTGS